MKDKDLPLADDELMDIYNQYKDLASKIKELQEKQEALKKKAKDWLAVENDTGAVDDKGKRIISLVEQRRVCIDLNLLKVNEPKVYAKYTKLATTNYIKFI